MNVELKNTIHTVTKELYALHAIIFMTIYGSVNLNKEVLELNQLVVHAADVNLLGKNIDITLDFSKAVGLELNTEKIKYIFMCCQHPTGQNDKGGK
jgi:hypothetical protein